jgi:hypothetical protein
MQKTNAVRLGRGLDVQIGKKQQPGESRRVRKAGLQAPGPPSTKKRFGTPTLVSILEVNSYRLRSRLNRGWNDPGPTT